DGHERLRLDAELGPSAPADGGTQVPLSLVLHCPGVVRELRLEQARARLGGGRTDLAATVAFEHLTLRRLEDWLAGQGVAMPRVGCSGGATLQASLRDVPGGTAIDAGLRDFTLASGDERLL